MENSRNKNDTQTYGKNEHDVLSYSSISIRLLIPRFQRKPPQMDLLDIL